MVSGTIYIEHTEGHLIYACVEKYSERGKFLDLGCGSGNTANELDYESFESYIGTDLSKVATRKAELTTKENQREAKVKFICCDIESFVPSTAFNAILLRESLYYIQVSKIKAVLDRYAEFLKPNGVFVVRMHDRKTRRDRRTPKHIRDTLCLKRQKVLHFL
jgi:SAM-dependent methyltransferase